MSRSRSELQKLFKEQDYEKYQNKFKSTISLWQLDDKSWLENRKLIWQKIFDRQKAEDECFSKSSWDEAGRFFIKAKPRKNDKEIHLHRRMAYTPFSSTQQVVDLYLAERDDQKRRLHEQLLSYVNHLYRSVPEEFEQVELIARALYNKDFFAKKSIVGNKSEEFVVTGPRDFIIRFANETRNYLQRSNTVYLDKLKRVHQQEYTGKERSFVEFTLDFFFGSLAYVMDRSENDPANQLNKNVIKSFHKCFGLIESYEPDTINPFREEFVLYFKQRIANNKHFKEVMEKEL